MTGTLCACGAELGALTDEAHAEDCPNRPSVRIGAGLPPLQAEAVSILELATTRGPVPVDRARMFAQSVLDVDPLTRLALAVLVDTTGTRLVELCEAVAGVDTDESDGRRNFSITNDLLMQVTAEGLDLLVHAPRSKERRDWTVSAWDHADPRRSAIGVGPAFALALSQALHWMPVPDDVGTGDEGPSSTLPPGGHA